MYPHYSFQQLPQQQHGSYSSGYSSGHSSSGSSNPRPRPQQKQYSAANNPSVGAGSLRFAMPSASGEFGAPGGFSDPGGFIIPVMPSRPAPGHRPPAPDVGGFYIPPQGNYGGSFHPSSGSSGPGYPPAPNSGFHPTSWPGAYPQNTGPGGFVALGHHLGPGNFGYNNSGAPPPQPYMSSSNYNNQQRPRPIGPAPSMYQPKN